MSFANGCSDLCFDFLAHCDDVIQANSDISKGTGLPVNPVLHELFCKANAVSPEMLPAVDLDYFRRVGDARFEWAKGHRTPLCSIEK